jgi:hypothetical protein
MPSAVLDLPNFRDRTTVNILRVFLNMWSYFWIGKVLANVFLSSALAVGPKNIAHLRNQVPDIVDVKEVS